MMRSNPFAPSTLIGNEKGVCGDAKLIRSTFLYRVVDLNTWLGSRLTYSGWWFLQRVWIGRRRVWTKISWLNISPSVTFQVPAEIDPAEPEVRLEINFRPGLIIRRFRIWVAGELVYDEVR